MGSIIAVVAVLEIHIDKNAVTNIKAPIILKHTIRKLVLLKFCKKAKDQRRRRTRTFWTFKLKMNWSRSSGKLNPNGLGLAKKDEGFSKQQDSRNLVKEILDLFLLWNIRVFCCYLSENLINLNEELTALQKWGLDQYRFTLQHELCRENLLIIHFLEFKRKK